MAKCFTKPKENWKLQVKKVLKIIFNETSLNILWIFLNFKHIEAKKSYSTSTKQAQLDQNGHGKSDVISCLVVEHVALLYQTFF